MGMGVGVGKGTNSGARTPHACCCGDGIIEEACTPLWGVSGGESNTNGGEERVNPIIPSFNVVFSEALLAGGITNEVQIFSYVLYNN